MPHPKTMQAVRAPIPGDADALEIQTLCLPVPGPGEVLIRVAAAGINRLDVFQRTGNYPPPVGASDILGLEIAGEVVECGPEAGQFTPGDQVCALLQGGGYAEYAIASITSCLPVPRGLSMIEAAALPEAMFTVWSNVFMRGQLQPGESLLVQGGASGIGTTAIQLARAFGHTVYATAGSAAKCAACEALGADRAINYRTEDFVEVILALTNGRGVDVCLDMVGGSYIPRELKVLAEDGRICLIAFLGGARTELDLGTLLRRRLTLTGSTLRPRPPAFKAPITAALHDKVWPLLEQGKIRPIIQASYPFEQVRDAHRALENGDHIGKFVLSFP